MVSYSYIKIAVLYYLQLEEIEDNLIIFIMKEGEAGYVLHIAQGSFTEEGILEVSTEAFKPFMDCQIADEELCLVTAALSVKVIIKNMTWAKITVTENLDSFDEDATRSLITESTVPIPSEYINA